MAQLSATAMRVIMKQVQDIQANPIDGITLRDSDDLSVIEAELLGPEDTPFYGGAFVVALIMSSGYPEEPPKGYFRTRIFHPNVSEKGEICVNTLKKDWHPSHGLRHVLTVIRCLLIEPNPESALNEEAGRLLLEEYAEYQKKAKMMTSVHARRVVLAPAVVVEGAQAVSGPAGLTLRTATDSNASAAGAIVTTAQPVVDKKVVSAVDKKKAALKRL